MCHNFGLQVHLVDQNCLVGLPRTLPPDKVFLPYIPQTSRIIKGAIKPTNQQFIELPHRPLRSHLLPTQPPRRQIPLEAQSSIIYGIPCLDCDCVYIGQTRQTLKARISHHKSEYKNSCQNNSLFHHYLQTGHSPNFANLLKFFSQKNFRSRLNLEAGD